jgi:hypothetical protein
MNTTMNMIDEQLKKTFRKNDPADSLSHERVARLEACILERALNTPQMSGVAGGHTGLRASLLVFPLSSGVLAACALIMLGIVTGQNLSPVSSVQTVANFSVGVMAGPWQNWMSMQGAFQP